MSVFVESEKFDEIDIRQHDINVLMVAQILCSMKANALGEIDLEPMRKSLDASTTNDHEVYDPMDLAMTAPSQTSPAETPSPKGNFLCKSPGCNKSFASSKSLNQHDISHQPAQIPCNLCDPPKSFKTRSSLVSHRRTQHLCKPYSCDYVNCNEAFSDSQELEAHRSREHSKCFICGQTLLNSAGLKLHLRKCRLLVEVMAESDAKRRKEAERRSPSTGTSGYSSSSDQSLN